LREIGAVNTLDQDRGSDDLKHTTMDHKNARSSSASETVRIIAFNPVEPMAVMYQPKSAPNHNGKTTGNVVTPVAPPPPLSADVYFVHFSAHPRSGGTRAMAFDPTRG
jgi:hypothetical protein